MNIISPIKITGRAILDFRAYIQHRITVSLRKLVREQHQLTSVTATNRYPELFSEVRSIWKEKSTTSILSFGCSTGEECFSLISYFPKAKIVGADINNANLREARRKLRDENIEFVYSTPEAIAERGQYDIIFCLSVLCRWEETKDLENCAHVYSFEKFSNTVAMLSEQVKPGGLLVIFNSNFNFEETHSFKNFKILPTPEVLSSGFVHRFDSNNNRIKSVHKHCVYQKQL